MVQFPYILFSNKRWCCIYLFNTDFIISKMWTKRYYYFLKNAKKTENSQSLCFRHSADLALLMRAWLCIKNSHSNNSTLFRWFQIIFYTFCTFCTKDIKCTNNTLYIKCTLWTQHLSHIFWQKSKFQFSLFFRPFQGVYLFLSNLFISFHSDIYLTLIFYLTAVFPYYKILGMFHIFSSGILNLISSYPAFILFKADSCYLSFLFYFQGTYFFRMDPKLFFHCSKERSFSFDRDTCLSNAQIVFVDGRVIFVIL